MTASNLGLDFVAYSNQSGSWSSESASCYVDSSPTPTTQTYMCQKYDDHVHNHQIDNTQTVTSEYGMYEWICGDGNVSVCNSGNCS